MGAFEDLFHTGRDSRNRQGYQGNQERNRNAPDPYGQTPIYGPDPRNSVDLPLGNTNYPDIITGWQNNQVTFDETGRPIVNNRPIHRPGADYALDYQYLVEQEAERRRLGLWSDAQNMLRQGLDLFQSYRPGGSAALASGMFNQSASLYGTQALNTFAPDMLSEYRNKQLEDAKRERERARNFSERLALGQFAMNPLGLLNSGPTPQSPAAAPTETPPSPGTPSAPTAPGGGTVAPAGGAGGAGALQAGGGGTTLIGPGGENLAGDRGAYGAPGQEGGSGPMSRVQRAGGGGASVDGGFGAGGSPGGPVGGGGGGGRRMGGGPGQGIGGMGLGGGPPIQTYTGAEAATRAQMGAPVSTDATLSSWAGSSVRSESVGLRVAAARSSLLDAIQLAGNPVGGLVSLLI